MMTSMIHMKLAALLRRAAVAMNMRNRSDNNSRFNSSSSSLLFSGVQFRYSSHAIQHPPERTSILRLQSPRRQVEHCGTLLGSGTRTFQWCEMRTRIPDAAAAAILLRNMNSTFEFGL